MTRARRSDTGGDVAKAIVSKKLRRVKTVKEENAPKKAKTSWNYFSNEQRAKLKSQDQKLSFAEASKIIGQAWKALNAQEKKPYQALSVKDKMRYKVEKAAFEASKELVSLTANQSAEETTVDEVDAAVVAVGSPETSTTSIATKASS